MRLRKPHLRIPTVVREWFTYGTTGWWGRFTHVLIAVFSAFLFWAAWRLSKHCPWPSWCEVASTSIQSRLAPKEFAYVMTILTSLLAAVCTGFCASEGTSRAESDMPKGRAALIAAFAIALLAAIASTIGFAATFAMPPENNLTQSFYMLYLAFLQLTISAGIVGLTLIPIVSNWRHVLSVPLVMAMSTVFWLPAVWLAVFLIAMPAMCVRVVPTLLVALAFTCGQAFYPHGTHSRLNRPHYLATIDAFAAAGLAALTCSCIVGGMLIALSLAIPDMSVDWRAKSLGLPLLLIGVAMWCLSVHTEGIRKLQNVAEIGARSAAPGKVGSRHRMR